MKKYKLHILLLGLLAVIAGWLFTQSVQENTASTTPAQQETNTQAYLQINDRCLELAVAASQEEKSEGLSGYDNLASDEGMLFVYDQPGEYGFWMKNMEFAIDIFWLTEDNEVVGVKEEAQPSSYPQTFHPDQPAKKVVETPAGFTKTENINLGDRLNLTNPTTTSPGGC